MKIIILTTLPLLLMITTTYCGVVISSIPTQAFVRSDRIGNAFSYSTLELSPTSRVSTYQQGIYNNPLLQQHLQFIQQFPIYQNPIFGGVQPILQNPILQQPVFGGQPVADVPVSQPQPPAPAQTPVAGIPLDEDTVAVDAAV